MKQQYNKRSNQPVVAVQLALTCEGFTYQKWGSEQRCKPDDWIVLNNGDTYTVDNESFQTTYRSIGPGCYIKVARIWAEQAIEAGRIRTKEGTTEYAAGDYIVFNGQDATDGYAISKEKFEEMYQLIPQEGSQSA